MTATPEPIDWPALAAELDRELRMLQYNWKLRRRVLRKAPRRVGGRLRSRKALADARRRPGRRALQVLYCGQKLSIWSVA